MARILAQPLAQLVFAVSGALAFAGSLLFFVARYAWGFDGEPAGGALPAVVFNLLLFSVFALHHSILARAGAKQWLARAWPPELERSLYVWVSSLLFLSTCGLWQPVPGLLWDVQSPARLVMRLGQLAAAVLAVMTARRLDVLDLSGVLQVISHGTAPSPRALDDRGPYGFVRHPIYLSWLLLVWLAPTMNGTRLVFALVSSAYLFVAVPFEERDLRRVFGRAYEQYSRRVKWRIIPYLY